MNITAGCIKFTASVAAIDGGMFDTGLVVGDDEEFRECRIRRDPPICIHPGNSDLYAHGDGLML